MRSAVSANSSVIVRKRRETCICEPPARPPVLRRVLDAVAPDFVHAGPVPTSAFVAAAAGFRPLAAMSWGSDLLVDADRDEAWRQRARYALERSDLLFCDCDAVRERAWRLAGFPADRIVQFPWGVDLDLFRPDGERLPWRDRPGWGAATPLVATRSWEPGYGIETLLESFARATSRRGGLRPPLPRGGGPPRGPPEPRRRRPLNPPLRLGPRGRRRRLPCRDRR